MSNNEFSKDKLPKIDWIKNGPQYNYFTDGSVFLVALQVKNSKTNQVRWEFDTVQIHCDDDYFGTYYRGSNECYDAWNFEDFEYFYLLEGEMPKDGEL